jgi:hypothetical protein
MALRLFNKLQKLKINVYGNRLRVGLPQAVFKVMLNPASLSVSHANEFSRLQGINTKGREAKYIRSQPREHHLELILDGTGVTDFGLSTLLGKGSGSVASQIKQFLDLCFHMDGKIHEPRFLKIQWGEGELKDFDCRLKSVDIEYTLFDENGTPLRAVLKTNFIEDLAPGKRPYLEGKNSPDLSHIRVVKSGDTLPLLSKEIYGSSQYYMRLAQVNNIDDFRNLTPGQELIFPPLAGQRE